MEASILQGGAYSPMPSPYPKPEIVNDTGKPSLTLLDVNQYVTYRTGPWWRGACFRKAHVKQVLHNITLALPAGQIIGVIGSSGAGKSTLLDVIAFRTDGFVTGLMTYQGHRSTKQMMRQRVSYVIQADRLLPNLTVKETITYTAYLKLPETVPKRKLKEMVDSVINKMGLRAVANSRVGGAVVRGVSGGEKRRVTIALKLLKDPDILLLDEPTTGLDSFTARHLVANLQELARKGKVVVMSLHQPRSDIVGMLDQTVLMSGGHVMFSGPTTDIVPYFSELGYPCPTYANPLDTYIDLVSIDRREAENFVKSTNRVHALKEAYLNSELLACTKDKVRERSKTLSFLSETHRKPGWFRIFSTIVCRMFLNLSRDWQGFFNRLFLLAVYTFFILIFVGKVRHTQSSIQDRLGLLYNSVQVPTHMGVLNTVQFFPALRDLFYRECFDGLYSAPTFLLAYLAHIIPLAIVNCLSFSGILYWVSGMYPELNRFGMYVTVVFFLYLCGELTTMAVMGIFKNPQMSNTICSLVYFASGILATGFLCSLQTMSEELQQLSYASVYRYASEILVANEFRHLNLTCQEEIQGLPCMSGDTFAELNWPGAFDNTQRNFEVMVAMTIFFLIMAIFTFKVFGLKHLH